MLTVGGVEAPVGQGRIIEVQVLQVQQERPGKEKSPLLVGARPTNVRMPRRASGPKITGQASQGDKRQVISGAA